MLDQGAHNRPVWLILERGNRENRDHVFYETTDRESTDRDSRVWVPATAAAEGRVTCRPHRSALKDGPLGSRRR